MKRILLLLFLSASLLEAQNGLHLVGHLDNKHGATSGLNYSGSWGYVAPDGREYAILGNATGTAIIEITDTANIHEIVHIPGPTSVWREMRTYKDRLYVVTENGGGTQIIDLSQLPDTATLVKSFTYTIGAKTTAYSHTIEIFDGTMYLNGCAQWGTIPQRGVVMFSLADKDNPQYVGEYAPNYFHDSFVRNDTLFGASVYSTGGIYIADIHDKSSPVAIGKISYAGSGTHNVWSTKDGRYVISTDEIGSTVKSLKFWDLTSLPTIPTTPAATYLFNGLGDIEHNVFVRGDYAYTAWYTAGTVVVDVADPTNPLTAGWYDSSNDILFPPGNYDGVWAVYPYYWSGKITAGDMQNGLYVFTFDGLKPRTPASLLQPADNHLQCVDGSLTFQWTRVADQAADPVRYQLHVFTTGFDTLLDAGTDSAIAVNTALFPRGTLHWSVLATDVANAISTQDTFTLLHPELAPVVTSPNGGETVTTGTNAPVTWTASPCTDSVDVSYSVDGGADWAAVGGGRFPNTGNLVWSVPVIPTTANARLRVRSTADTTLADLSNAAFTIFNPAIIFVFSPNGGEVWRSGSVHNVLLSPGGATHVAVEYTTDAGANWYPIVADTTPVSSVSWHVPLITSSTVRVRVTDIDAPLTFDESDGDFTIAPLVLDLAGSWNLVAFPGVPADPLAAANFPGASSLLYGYNVGYSQADSVYAGRGYWIKYPAAQTRALLGDAIDSVSIPVNARWNMIGGVTDPVPVSALQTTPGSMTLSVIYGYDPGSGYSPADTIEPGHGYWVKASEAGELSINGGLAAKPRPAIVVEPPDLIVFTDARGERRTLGVGKTGDELPPPPPAGELDVRFASQRCGESIGMEGQPIELHGGVFPMTVHLEGADVGAYRLVVRGEHGVQSYPLGANDVTIATRPRGDVRIERTQGTSSPRGFSLQQNWPNPFNPVTTITFDLGAETHVSLKVYNVLGSEVATLVDGVMNAGSHRVDFNAGNLPSGVYLCAIRTEAGTDMRKMLLAR